MKILIFTENLRAGGKERRIIELLKGLKHHEDIQFELVLTKNIIHYDEIFELKVPIHFVERKYFKKDPMVFFKFYSVAKKIKPDIIHVWGHMVSVYAVPTKLFLGVPLINNAIVDALPNQKLLGERIVFKVSDRIIANSYAGLKAHNAPITKSAVIYNGFTFDRLNNIESAYTVRMRFSINTTYVVGMVASFLPYKDYETYIQAAIQVLEKQIDITFLCIGDGDDSEYKKMVPAQFQRNILFLGRQSQVESIMNLCDIGVLTTNTRHAAEGISNALMEFMALAKPVVATNCGGSVELIEQEQSGYLIDPFSPTQLAEKISFLIKDSSTRFRMGQRAVQTIREKFSLSTMIRLFYGEYKNAL